MTRTTSDASWLFTRGCESVRLTRIETQEGGVRLVVRGPGQDTRAIEFRDPMACTEHQLTLERRLLLQGYGLCAESNRRRHPERRAVSRGADRRDRTD